MFILTISFIKVLNFDKVQNIINDMHKFLVQQLFLPQQQFKEIEILGTKNIIGIFVFFATLSGLLENSILSQFVI